MRARHRPDQIAVVEAGRVEVVERLGHQQIGVGVEVAGKLVALVAQVALDLEFDLVVEAPVLVAFGAAAGTAELLRHVLARQIGDVADHARQAQAAHRPRAVFVEMAAVEVGIGEDGLAGDVVEGDVLRGQFRRRGDDQRVAYPFRVGNGPAQRLHAAQTAAHHRCPAVDAEDVGEACLGIHPVTDRDDREIGAPGLAGGRVDRRRAGRAVAAARIVQADDEEAVGVERAAGADDVVPPADVVWLVRVVAGNVVMAGKRMADQDGVGFVSVQRAVGLDGQVVGRQDAASAQV
ncbi:hypothetical protein SDC9_148687 [bioreactor metagenome]|uniref:Uncharacterized protein n=1 Tax=bioreactor metagenome TaxID=1076179 RepID=A0A645EHI8_9ZZZZ